MKRLVGLNGEQVPNSFAEKLDGVGMVRGEYLCRQTGAWLSACETTDLLTAYLSEQAARFAPRPVWYRLVDMESNEANLMRGHTEPIREKTTMLGLRGLRRSLKRRSEFDAEIGALATVARNWPNLKILLPFVRDAREVEAALNGLDRLGFKNEVGVMAEIPSAILQLQDILSLGIRSVTRPSALHLGSGMSLGDMGSACVRSTSLKTGGQFEPSFWNS